MTPEVAAPSEALELKKEALALIENARRITIKDDADYQLACAGLVRIAGGKKKLQLLFAKPKKDAFQTHRGICELEEAFLAYYVEGERIYKGEISRYHSEQARIRREEQTRIEAELRRKEEDRRIAEAEALAAGGQQEAAEELLDEPVYAPIVELAVPSAPGVSGRKHFSYRVVDISKMNRDFMVENETKIRKTVNALGLDAMQLVGGIEVVEDQIVSVRASG